MRTDQPNYYKLEVATLPIFEKEKGKEGVNIIMSPLNHSKNSQ